jgi:hypothetical protein
MSLSPPFLPGTYSREYKLFISHAWDYTAAYDGVVSLLNADKSFKWINRSVPVDEPLSAFMSPLLLKSYRSIVRQLDERIRESDCVLVLAAMYVAHRGWIQSEIEAALEFKKPIIAVRPLGQERVPQALSQEAITDQVGWRTDSIISAIRRHVQVSEVNAIVRQLIIHAAAPPPPGGPLMPPFAGK